MLLTRRQKQILDFVTAFIRENGYSPSLEEIGREFGLTSVSTIHKHVSGLIEKGLMRGKLTGDIEACKPNGVFLPLSSHEEFRAHFPDNRPTKQRSKHAVEKAVESAGASADNFADSPALVGALAVASVAIVVGIALWLLFG